MKVTLEGADFQSQSVSRRSLLRGIPAAAALGVTASTALAGLHQQSAADGDTPILRLFHQREAIMEAAKEHVTSETGEDADEEMERLFYNQADRLDDEMMALPSTCAADFAAKVIVATSRASVMPCWESAAIWQEACALTGVSA